METSECLCKLRGKCCHSNAPVPCQSDCLGETKCDVVMTKESLDNKELVEILEKLKR